MNKTLILKSIVWIVLIVALVAHGKHEAAETIESIQRVMASSYRLGYEHALHDLDEAGSPDLERRLKAFKESNRKVK